MICMISIYNIKNNYSSKRDTRRRYFLWRKISHHTFFIFSSELPFIVSIYVHKKDWNSQLALVLSTTCYSRFDLTHQSRLKKINGRDKKGILTGWDHTQRSHGDICMIFRRQNVDSCVCHTCYINTWIQRTDNTAFVNIKNWAKIH